MQPPPQGSTPASVRSVVGRHPVRNLMLYRAERMFTRPPSIRAAAGVIVTATTIVVVVGALAMRVLDGSEFPDIWRSLWWSVQTATTVGYGDVTPKKAIGKVVAAVVMLEGVAIVAVVTASITSVFVTRAQREYGRDNGWQQVLERLDALDRRLDGAAGRSGGSPSSHDVGGGGGTDAPQDSPERRLSD